MTMARPYMTSLSLIVALKSSVTTTAASSVSALQFAATLRGWVGVFSPLLARHSFFLFFLYPPLSRPAPLLLRSSSALTEALSGETEQSDNAASLPRTRPEPKREQRWNARRKKWQNKQKNRRQSGAKRGTR